MLDSLRTLFQEPLAFFDQAIFRVLAVLIALCCGVAGLVLSYYLNTSAGAAIVLCAAAVYFATLPLRRK